MKIGIDFDRVLFKTDEFKEYLEEEIPGFLEKYPGGKDVYNPEEHAQRLGVSKERIMSVLSDARQFLYEDIEELEELKPGHELILVSRGEPLFQGKKVANSGICELLDAIVVLQNGSKDRMDIDFLVDDREFEHEKTDIPGLLFDRSKHTVDDIVEKVRELEARSSV